MFVALVGLGIQLRWPEQRELGTAFIILGAVVGAGMLLWVLAQRRALASVITPSPLPNTTPQEVKQSQSAHSQVTNAQVIHNVFAPSSNQSQLVEEQTVAAKAHVPPEIECTECYFVKQTLLPAWNRLSGDVGRPCMAAQADFCLKPLPGADPWIELRTQLVFYGPNGTRLRRVRDGMWTEQGNVVQMPMRTGDTRTLVIALEFQAVGFSTYEYAEQPSPRRRYTTTGIYTHDLIPLLTQLNEETLTVQVSLIGKYNENVTLNQDFWFSLTRPEMTIKQTSAPHFEN
jgi:hypothetical protein